MPSNKQRREAARRKLERQLQAREERARRRRQGNLIASIVGGLVIVGLVIAFIVITSGEDSSSSGSSSAATSDAAAETSAAPSTTYPAAQGESVTFNGVTVGGATDLGGRPEVTSAGTTDPTELQYKDLVVGTGASPTASDSVTVQYIGVLYKDGTVFDESWKNGEPATFSLSGVITGFTKGIAGDGASVPAMKVGGRRILIIPASMGYGATAQGNIPANSTLVFVIDLLAVTPAAATAS